jgi:predicted  nucleic acid-binding Zn-ribbon protein
MAGPAVTLRELHRLRRFAKELEEQIQRLPQQQKIQETRVARQEEGLKNHHEAIKKLKVNIHDKEVSLKTTHQQIAKLEKQRNEAGGKKEYDALAVEIAAARQSLAKLEDEILTLMTEVDEKTNQVPQLEAALKQAKTDLANFESILAGKKRDLAEELERTRQQLGETEGGLIGDPRAMYDRLISQKGQDAMAAVHGRTCSACYTEITAQSSNELSMGNFVLCKNCGRMLYLAEAAAG